MFSAQRDAKTQFIYFSICYGALLLPRWLIANEMNSATESLARRDGQGHQMRGRI